MKPVACKVVQWGSGPGVAHSMVDIINDDKEAEEEEEEALLLVLLLFFIWQIQLKLDVKNK